MQLTCGELAIVIRRGASANAPLAAAITDKTGTPTVHTTRRDTAQPAFAIQAMAAASPMVQRMTAERLYGLAE